MTLEEEDALWVLWHLETQRPYHRKFATEEEAAYEAARLNGSQYVEGYLGTYVVMTNEESRSIVH